MASAIAANQWTKKSKTDAISTPRAHMRYQTMSGIEALTENALNRVAAGETAYLIGTAAAPVGELAAALRRKVDQRGLRVKVAVDGDVVGLSRCDDPN